MLKIIAPTNEVEITLFILFFSLAPIFLDNKIAIPLVAPIATEVNKRIGGMDMVRAAMAFSPSKFPIQTLSTMLYAMLNIKAISNGIVIPINFFVVLPVVKSFSNFLFI